MCGRTDKLVSVVNRNDAEMKSTVDAPDWSSIPAPVDDGATRHLIGARLASVSLEATDGATVDLSTLPGRSVV